MIIDPRLRVFLMAIVDSDGSPGSIIALNRPSLQPGGGGVRERMLLAFEFEFGT